MNILVFGATGATGKQVVAQALERGWSVTAFARDSSKLERAHPALRIVQGNVADVDAVRAALPGHDAVISVLGVGTPLKHDPAVIAGIEHIVNAMQVAGTKRFIYLSFIGVAASRAAAGKILRFASRFPLRHEVADHEMKEATVAASPLDWTIVRPAKLTNGAFTGKYRSGESIAARSLIPTVPRADVADLLLRQVEDGQFVRKAVRVMS